MKDESITTAQSQPPRIDVPIGRQILRSAHQTLDLEDSLFQVQVYVWLALILVVLSLGCSVIILQGMMVEDTQNYYLRMTSTK